MCGNALSRDHVKSGNKCLDLTYSGGESAAKGKGDFCGAKLLAYNTRPG